MPKKLLKHKPIIAGFPHILHGGDYNPDQWLHCPEIINEDFRLAKIAGCNAFSICIFGWSAIEPQEGVYNFAWLDDIMERLHACGYKAILATPSAAKPAWLATEYPEVRRIKADGRREPQITRHNHCYSSPVYRKKVANINRRLAERYGEHPALGMWHVSNEYNGCCYCELCLDNFRRWLKNRYQSLEALNEAWWTSFWSHTFSSWEQINPFDYSIECQVIDWKRFITAMTVEFYQHEVAALREYSVHTPITINMMGTFEGLDYYKFAPHVSVITDDHYPQYCADEFLVDKAVNTSFTHDMHRAMKKGQPWMLMESCPSATNWQPVSKLKAPGIHTLEMIQAVAHGADGCLYFQYRKSRGCQEKFHGAVIDHVGHEHTRVFREVSEVGNILSRLDGIIGTTTKAEVALIYDWENRWALQASSGPNNNNQDDAKGYLDECLAHYKPFWQAGYAVDVIESTADFTGYRLLVAPMLYMTRAGVAERLKQFVHQGGTVVMTYLSGIVDQRALCHLGGWPGEGLREVFGIWAEELDAPHDHETHTVRVKAEKAGFSGTFTAKTYCDLIHAEKADILGTYREDFYKGRPALTVNTYGKGRAFYLAFRSEGPDFPAAFYRTLAKKIKLKSAWPQSLPDGVFARQRTAGKDKFTFLMNFTGKRHKLKPDRKSFTDLVSNKKISGTITLAPWQTMILKKQK